MNHFRTLMLLAAMTALFMGLGYMIAGPRGAVLALIVAAAMNLVTYWNADRIVLAMHDAKEMTVSDCPQLVGMIHDLAARAGIPNPRVYLVDSPHPNAFATGRDPEHAAVAATTGLLGLLSKAEVAAVMAHELGHVRNRDTLVMTMTATIAGAISMLANFGFFFRGGDRANPLAMIAAILLAPFAAMLVQLAISRTREYGADRAAAEICGDPRALASALAKLHQGAARIPSPVAMRNPAAASLHRPVRHRPRQLLLYPPGHGQPDRRTAGHGRRVRAARAPGGAGPPHRGERSRSPWPAPPRVSEIVEIALKVVFRILAEIVLRFVAYVALSVFFIFFRRTGDFLIELVTLDYFRDHSNVPLDWKPLHPVPHWASALLGVIFWCEFAAAVYLSWPWLASL